MKKKPIIIFAFLLLSAGSIGFTERSSLDSPIENRVNKIGDLYKKDVVSIKFETSGEKSQISEIEFYDGEVIYEQEIRQALLEIDSENASVDPPGP